MLHLSADRGVYGEFILKRTLCLLSPSPISINTGRVLRVDREATLSLIFMNAGLSGRIGPPSRHKEPALPGRSPSAVVADCRGL